MMENKFQEFELLSSDKEWKFHGFKYVFILASKHFHDDVYTLTTF